VEQDERTIKTVKARQSHPLQMINESGEKLVTREHLKQKPIYGNPKERREPSLKSESG